MKGVYHLILGAVAVLTVFSPVVGTSQVDARPIRRVYLVQPAPIVEIYQVQAMPILGPYAVYYRLSGETDWRFYDSFRHLRGARRAERRVLRHGYETSIR
jgi:hypothetical protein